MYEDNHYSFAFDSSVTTSLIEKATTCPKWPLIKGIGPIRQGVYLLYWKNDLVYVGKVVSIGLRTRLNDHVLKVSGRVGIHFDDMSVRFLTFEQDWFVNAAEEILIKALTPPWNNSGFGCRPFLDRRKNNVNVWEKMFPKKTEPTNEP